MFETGTQVWMKDPVFFDEEIRGFVAKQLDDTKFLVKIERPFKRSTEPGKIWYQVSRSYAHQGLREVGSEWWTQITPEEIELIGEEHGIYEAHVEKQTGTDRLIRGRDNSAEFWHGMWYDGESLYDIKWEQTI